MMAGLLPLALVAGSRKSRCRSSTVMRWSTLWRCMLKEGKKVGILTRRGGRSRQILAHNLVIGGGFRMDLNALLLVQASVGTGSKLERLPIGRCPLNRGPASNTASNHTGHSRGGPECRVRPGSGPTSRPRVRAGRRRRSDASLTIRRSGDRIFSGSRTTARSWQQLLRVL